VRQARLPAGLSLSDLAGPELTRQAVHLIETGKSRPSMRSLRHIADRLNMPVEAFLLPDGAEEAAVAESRSAELAQLCQAYRYAEAEELTRRILARNPAGRLRAVAHFYLGQALCQLKQAEEALHHLQQARAHAESAGDPALAAEAMGWQASAYYVVDHPCAAVELGEEALRRYRKLEPRQAHVESHMLERLGTFLLRRGAHQQACHCYQEALATAGAAHDLVRLARIYHGMGQIEWVLGNRARATELGERAVALYATERESSRERDAPGVRDVGVGAGRERPGHDTNEASAR
jgi:tetratricopeptide (TPR) repeat protein